MTTPPRQRYQAGGTVEDLCRVCKEIRSHTIVVTNGAGQPLRVVCDYCSSQHNYRGGGARSAAVAGVREATRADGGTWSLVDENERSFPVTDLSGEFRPPADLELMLRCILREELGLTPAVPASKWRGGKMTLEPGREGLQEKSWPIETFFKKIVMLRNRLRTLEQQINAADLPGDLKLKLQGYITACYGSLTSFNILFADDEDKFKGAGKDDQEPAR